MLGFEERYIKKKTTTQKTTLSLPSGAAKQRYNPMGLKLTAASVFLYATVQTVFCNNSFQQKHLEQLPGPYRQNSEVSGSSKCLFS